jgi:hypothetical protein
MIRAIFTNSGLKVILGDQSGIMSHWVDNNAGSSVSVDFDERTSVFKPTSLIGIYISFEIVSVLAEAVNVTFAVRSWVDLSVKVLFSSAFPEL